MPKKDEKPEADSLDDLMAFDPGEGRYDGPEEIPDPEEEARKAKRRSNMDKLIAADAPERKARKKSDMDKIFGS